MPIILCVIFSSFVAQIVSASGGIGSTSQTSDIATQHYSNLSQSNNLVEEKNTKVYVKDNRNLSDFFTDALAYQTAILALLIPLSFDVVSRISDRYKSDIIIKRFQEERVFFGLIFVLVLNIILMFILRFFSIEDVLANFVVLVLVFISIILMCRFFLLIFEYTSGTTYIKRKLLNDAKQLLK